MESAYPKLDDIFFRWFDEFETLSKLVGPTERRKNAALQRRIANAMEMTPRRMREILRERRASS